MISDSYIISCSWRALLCRELGRVELAAVVSVVVVGIALSAIGTVAAVLAIVNGF